MLDADASVMPLPSDGGCVKLSCLDGGSFIAAESKVHAGVTNGTFRMYNWAFLVQDVQSGRNVLWDLGLSGRSQDYTPWVQKYMLSDTQAVGPSRSIVEQLQKRGIGATDIDAVLFSHAHWDHCRPIDEEFPIARAYFGPGTSEYCAPGHLVSEATRDTIQWDGRYFDPSLHTQDWKELEGPWVKFGAFEKAMDFFGNASFWIIQAPGHMPGNLCALAHVGEGQWVLLGSDCCHSRRLFDGLEEFAVWKMPDGSSACLQADLVSAKDTLKRIKKMEEDLGCHIAFAHDTQWIQSGTNETLMSMLDEDMRSVAVDRLARQAVF